MFAAMDLHTVPQTLKPLEVMGEEQDILGSSWVGFSSNSSCLELSLSISRTVLILGRGEVWKETEYWRHPLQLTRNRALHKLDTSPQHKDRVSRAVTPKGAQHLPWPHSEPQADKGFGQTKMLSFSQELLGPILAAIQEKRVLCMATVLILCGNAQKRG